MQLYVNKNNPSEYQIGISFPNAVLCPEHITLNDVNYLTVKEIITPIEREISPEVLDEQGNVISERVVQIENEISYNFIVNEVAKAASQVQKSKQAQVSDAYNAMDNAVYSEMANVFGTTKSDSATAFYETWKLMKDKPNLFVNKVVVDKAVAGLSQGQLLTNEQDIVNFASARIEQAESYSVFRLEKINEFYAQRAQILGE